jgi:putative ABC transport system permease protein
VDYFRRINFGDRLVELAISRLVSDFIARVSPYDPLTYVSVTALLSAVALLACYFPARRATRVDPMIALRYE